MLDILFTSLFVALSPSWARIAGERAADHPPAGGATVPRNSAGWPREKLSTWVAEKRIMDRGYTTAELGVEHSNPRARALYERLCYVAYGDEPDEWDAEGPDGRIVPYRMMCALMRKPLPADPYDSMS